MPPMLYRPAAVSRTDRIPGLDGLRGVAVLLVVVYHLFPRWLPGGFVGVSLFFALSGFLITHRLLVEHRRTGRVSLGRFAVGRVRRIVPASVVAVVGVLAVWSSAGWLSADVVDDARWSLLQVSNWEQVVSGVRYGADTALNPLAHFWSLSVEEQMFWIFPAVFALVAVSRRRLAAVVVALFVGSALCAVLADDVSFVYFATLSRAAEFFAGSLAVIAVHTFRPRPSAFVASSVAAVAVSALVVFAFTCEADGRFVASGGLVVVGVVTAVAVAATSLSGRRAGAAVLFDVSLLRWVGSRSYGIYLYHWPVIVAVGRAGAAHAVLLSAAVTVVLAELSYRLVEQPFMRSVRRPVVWAASGSVVVLAATVVVPTVSSSTIDFDAAVASFATLVANDASVDSGQMPSPLPLGVSQTVTSEQGFSVSPPSVRDIEDTSRTDSTDVTVAGPGSRPVPVPSVVSAPPDPVDVFFVGDSKALTLALATASSGVDQVRVAGGWTNLGCPAGRGGRVRFVAGERAVAVAERCDWSDVLPSTLSAAAGSANGVDVAVVYFGSWDVALRELPAFGDRWLSSADGDYLEWLYGELVALNRTLLSSGAKEVVWLTLSDDPRAGDPLRAVRFNDLVARVAASEETTSVVDLAGWFEQQPDRDALLADNVHVTFEPDGGSGAVVVRRFLAAQLVAAARTGPGDL